MATPHVIGDQELDRFLRRLPQRIFRNALRKSTRVGAKTIQQRTIQAAPHRSFRRIIVRVNRRKGRRGRISFSVGPSTRAYYALYYELGASGPGQRRQPPRPWFRPAARAAQTSAVRATRRDLARSINKDAVRLANQTRARNPRRR